jgi:hypothetical protein
MTRRSLEHLKERRGSLSTAYVEHVPCVLVETTKWRKLFSETLNTEIFLFFSWRDCSESHSRLCQTGRLY